MVSLYHIRKITLVVLLLCINALTTNFGYSQQNHDSDEAEDDSNAANAETNANIPTTKPVTDNDTVTDTRKKSSSFWPALKKNEAGHASVRQFHEVLDDLLTEFGYDVKTGQLGEVKNLSIRKVTVNSSLPRSYADYVESLVAERVRENSRVKLLVCIPCKTKKSTLTDGKLIITSAQTNAEEMQRAADQVGIDNFMDVMLVYHTTHMVLAFNIFSTHSKELIWSRSYNSETLRTRFQKLAIDYSQLEKTKPGEDYVPEYRYMIGVGYAIVPNVGGEAKDRNMLALNLRGTEKFNNRKNEFGLNLSIVNTTSSLLSSYPTEKGAAPAAEPTATVPARDTPKPFTMAIIMHALYARNFLGNLESYNDVRYGLTGGLGFVLSTGYIAPTARVGWDIFFGKKFTVTIGGIYIHTSQILIGKEFINTKGGVGADCVFSYNL